MKFNDVDGCQTEQLEKPMTPEEERCLKLEALYIKKKALEEKLNAGEKALAAHERAMLLKYDHTQEVKN